MKLWSILLTVFVALQASAQQGVGNGGGGWECFERDGRTVRWIQTLDLYEAQNEWGYTIPPNSKPHLIQIEEKLNELEPLLPSFVKELRKQLERIKRIQKRTPIVLPVVKDDIVTITPNKKTCPSGKFKRIQIAVYYSSQQLQIDDTIFAHPLFSELERAALILHEAVYAYLRSTPGGDPNSIRTRQLVAYLFSTLRAADKAGLIEYLLNHPEFQNRNTYTERDGAYLRELKGEALETSYAFTKSLFEISLSFKRDVEKQKLENAYIAEISRIYDPNGFRRQTIEGMVKGYLAKVGTVSLEQMRKFVDHLPLVTDQFIRSHHFDCVRATSVGLEIPGQQSFLGFFFNPGAFEDPSFLNVNFDDWIQHVVVDQNVNPWAAASSFSHAPQIDTWTYFKQLSSNEMLGWTLHKTPGKGTYWDKDWSPILHYCKKRP